MNHSPIVFALIVSIVLPLAAADSPCDLIVSRLESARSPLSRSLTETLCRFAVTQRWISAGDVEAIQSRDDLRALLQKRGGEDLLEVGSRMFASFERDPRVPSSGVGWETHDTDHYRFFARPGSAAANDLEIIGVQAERSRAGMVKAFGLDKVLPAREAIVSTAKLPDAPDRPASDRLAIYLYGSRQEDTRKRLGRNGMGATSFSATIDQNGRGRLQPSIHALYHNAFSLAVLEHEIAHTVVMMAAFDPAALDKPLSGEAELKKAFFAGYHSVPAFLNEGVGDYGLYYAGFYPAWGLLGSPESLAASLQSQGKFPPLAKLLGAGQMLHAREHKTFSLAAATFLHYLLQTKGVDAVREWLLTSEHPDAAFHQRLGMTVEEAERGWLGWLRERAALRPL